MILGCGFIFLCVIVYYCCFGCGVMLNLWIVICWVLVFFCGDFDMLRGINGSVGLSWKDLRWCWMLDGFGVWGDSWDVFSLGWNGM